MNKFKYILWLIGIVVWNFGVPSAKLAYDVIAALFLRHIVDHDKLFARYFSTKKSQVLLV